MGKLAMFFYNTFNIYLKLKTISLLDHIQVTPLSYNDQQILATNISNNEIVDAVKQLRAWKAPGPDGLHTGFYKDN